MPAVLTTYNAVTNDAQVNLRWGIRKGRWGLPRLPINADTGTNFSWHALGTRAKGLPHGPRAPRDIWIKGKIDLYLFKVITPLQKYAEPFWPDEVSAGKVIYPYRFDIALVSQATQIPTAFDDPIPEALSDGIRVGATGGPSLVSVSETQFEALLISMRSNRW